MSAHSLLCGSRVARSVPLTEERRVSDIDGGEMYTQNTPTDIERMRSWMKDGMARSQFVAAANLSAAFPSCECPSHK